MGRRSRSTERHTQVFMLLLGIVAAVVGLSLAQSMTGLVGAATADVTPIIAPYVETFEAKQDGMPDLVFEPFGESVVLVSLTDVDRQYAAVLKQGKLVSLFEGEVNNPTLKVTLNSATLVALQYKDLTFDEAVDAGRVSFSSVYSVDSIAVEKVLLSIDIQGFE